MSADVVGWSLSGGGGVVVEGCEVGVEPVVMVQGWGGSQPTNLILEQV